MLAELIRYWTTFAPDRVRKYGYLQRLIALEFRERRCRTAWVPHVSRCREIILKAAGLVENPKTAVIVGSGLLVEVPIQDLADRFERVYLVDIFHMPQVRQRMRRYFNVKLLTGDVTGIFQMMQGGRSPGPLQPAPAPRIPHFADADLLVSCNCLTQLAGPFNDTFRTTRGFGDKDCDMLSAQVMEQHIQALTGKASGVAVLIADAERFAMQGEKMVARTDLLKGVRLPPSTKTIDNEEWDWLIAPHPEEHPAQDMVHEVHGRIYQHLSAEEKKAEEAAGTPPLTATRGDPDEGDLPADDGLTDIKPER